MVAAVQRDPVSKFIYYAFIYYTYNLLCGFSALFICADSGIAQRTLDLLLLLHNLKSNISIEMPEILHESLDVSVSSFLKYLRTFLYPINVPKKNNT